MFNYLVIGWTILALILIPVLWHITAPYGRYARQGWGLMINHFQGWIVMEMVSPICFVLAFFYNPTSKSVYNYLFLGLWLAHYINRSIVFPLRFPNKQKLMPLTIMINAVVFNVVNSSINGYYLGSVKPYYDHDYYMQWCFIAGILLFVLGWLINIYSDNVLLGLRKPGESGYKIPHGGLFEYVSAPNYLGEMIEWLGYAIAVGGLPAWSFAVWTAANLVPRAMAHHHWYQQQFPDYPANRKALIPFLL